MGAWLQQSEPETEGDTQDLGFNRLDDDARGALQRAKRKGSRCPTWRRKSWGTSSGGRGTSQVGKMC